MRDVLALILLALPIATAMAQTEKPIATGALSSNQIGKLLKDLGYEPEALAADVWQAPIKRDGWTVNVMVSISPDGDRCWLESKFGVIADPDFVPASAWRNLLAENERIAPCFFAFAKTDKSLHLYKTFDNIGVTGARLKKELDAFDGVVRKTQMVWRSENFTAAEMLPVPPRPIEAPPKASSPLEGAWRVVRFEDKGESHTENELIGQPRIVFENDRATVKVGLRPERKVRVKIDPAQKPKAIDFIAEDGAVEAGIYIYETGLLTVCFASAGEDRPRQFVADAKSKHWLVVLKREE